MLDGLGHFWLAITDQDTGRQNIPIDIVQKYLIPDIKGFIGNAQVICLLWENVVNILNRVGVVLPYRLSEIDALEIFDDIGHYTCIKHKLNNCDGCNALYEYELSIRGYRYNTPYTEFFIENEGVRKREKLDLAQDPNRRVNGSIFYTSIGMIQMCYQRNINHNKNIPFLSVDDYVLERSTDIIQNLD